MTRREGKCLGIWGETQEDARVGEGRERDNKKQIRCEWDKKRCFNLYVITFECKHCVMSHYWLHWRVKVLIYIVLGVQRVCVRSWRLCCGGYKYQGRARPLWISTLTHAVMRHSICVCEDALKDPRDLFKNNTNAIFHQTCIVLPLVHITYYLFYNIKVVYLYVNFYVEHFLITYTSIIWLYLT